MSDKKSYIIVGHIYSTGPGDYLEKYLKSKSSRLLFIGHPFPYTKKSSFLRIYKNGILLKEKNFINISGPEGLFYIKDILLTLWWVFLYGKKTDYYIGCDNMNAFSGILLKYLRLVKNNVFYTIDYIPNRFQNHFLNSLYHFLDKFAVVKSDVVWNLSSVMVRERTMRGLDSKFSLKQLVVPIGTTIDRHSKLNKNYNRNKIVHIGHLRKNQGIELLINSMKKVCLKIPKARLCIIGGGPLENDLKKLANKLYLQNNIEFTGFLPKFSDAINFLKDGGVGIAAYDDGKTSYTRYTDPGKPKDYLSFGIPVIITTVPEVAKEIEYRKAGFSIPFKKDALEDAIIEMLTISENKYVTFRKNSLEMARLYQWDKVFDKALKETNNIIST